MLQHLVQIYATSVNQFTEENNSVFFVILFDIDPCLYDNVRISIYLYSIIQSYRISYLFT